LSERCIASKQDLKGVRLLDAFTILGSRDEAVAQLG
jgi:hypothetical protein